MNEKEEWPLVTVFTLIYNTGRYVIEALESVKANNYPRLQHIIIDDCSTDGTSFEIVRQWINENNYPCELIKHETNRGICESLNEVLTLTKGKYVFGVSDDLIMPDKIRTQVQLLEGSADSVAMVYSDVYMIDENGNQRNETYLESQGYTFETMPHGNCLKEMFIGNFIPAISIMTKTSCFKEIGHYDTSLYYEDWDMNIRILKKYEIFKSNYISAKYRVHSASLIRTKNPRIYDSSLIVEFRNLGISPEIDSLIKKRMIHDVEHYYSANGKESGEWLLRVFRKTFSLKILFFFICFQLGLKHYQVVRGKS